MLPYDFFFQKIKKKSHPEKSGLFWAFFSDLINIEEINNTKNEGMMKKFLVLFVCAEKSANHLDWMMLGQEAQKERLIKGTTAMEDWMKKYENKIKLEGSSLGNKTITVDSKGIHENPSKMGKFIVVEANSLEVAASMFLDHPHFKFFPGDAVEVLEFVEDKI